MPDMADISVSRIIERKKTHLVLGVFAVVDGRRVGTAVNAPRELDKDEVEATLDFGEAALRKQVAIYLAQKAQQK